MALLALQLLQLILQDFLADNPDPKMKANFWTQSWSPYTRPPRYTKSPMSALVQNGDHVRSHAMCPLISIDKMNLDTSSIIFKPIFWNVREEVHWLLQKWRLDDYMLQQGELRVMWCEK